MGIDFAHIHKGTLEVSHRGGLSIQKLLHRSGGGRGQGVVPPLRLELELRRAVTTALEVCLHVLRLVLGGGGAGVAAIIPSS